MIRMTRPAMHGYLYFNLLVKNISGKVTLIAFRLMNPSGFELENTLILEPL